MKPDLRFIPSTDGAFREHVQRVAEQHRFGTPSALAERLRSIFPRVTVRASDVSDQAGVWYVYRDGVWRPNADVAWWTDPRTPHVAVTREGWIEEADPSARAILGIDDEGGLPRFFTDFIAPGSLQDATDLFAVVAAGRELVATILLRPASGEVIACDLRAWTEGDRIIGVFRFAEDIPVVPAARRGPRPRLQCHPRSDRVFARYAAEACERMPEPEPEGLALRLRRLYPHAMVEADDGSWHVFRDRSRLDGAGVEWWRDAGLPTIHYDRLGRISNANAPARGLLGGDIVGRHWQEIVVPGTADEVEEVLRMIAEEGRAVSRFRLPAADASLFEFDSYTEVTMEGFVTVMRAVPPSVAVDR